ncbi:glycosyltransferase [Neolewinella antarctica]|uniref:Glycosyltransferase involved in cell wall biosynthesis n=1 Tax=Neolewinella antarctica TaxID=442734 RepID=A0ABX0XEW9_9BACT|nr:glycosyltransferase [Neolewinella antarctica]NJC27454.1 glycosyltransferase involved in cell wall biosynthesis [Neolewinella antarctica]
MKIALLGPANPYRGGLAAFNERLAVELAKEHAVTIFTFTLQYPDFLFPGKSQFTDAPPPPDVRIERTLSSINPVSWVRTGRAIKRGGFDLLLIGYWLPFMGPAFGTVARVAGVPTIAVVHNIIPHERRVGDRQLSRYFAASCAAFISLTDSVHDDLRAFVENKPSIISPHPIYDHFGTCPGPAPIAIGAQKNLGLSANTEYILFFGLVREYKGLDLLLHAMADERLKKRGTKLLVAGEFYGGRAETDALIEELGIGDQILLYDRFIPDDRVKDFFCAAELLVQPYRRATQSGVTPVAYHFELPMVVTNVGGLPAMCPDGVVGYVVEPTPAAIADGIVKYLTETDRAAMRENIKTEKLKYEWAGMVENVLGLWSKVSKSQTKD